MLSIITLEDAIIEQLCGTSSQNFATVEEAWEPYGYHWQYKSPMEVRHLWNEVIDFELFYEGLHRLNAQEYHAHFDALSTYFENRFKSNVAIEAINRDCLETIIGLKAVTPLKVLDFNNFAANSYTLSHRIFPNKGGEGVYSKLVLFVNGLPLVAGYIVQSEDKRSLEEVVKAQFEEEHPLSYTNVYCFVVNEEKVFYGPWTGKVEEWKEWEKASFEGALPSEGEWKSAALLSDLLSVPRLMEVMQKGLVYFVDEEGKLKKRFQLIE